MAYAIDFWLYPSLSNTRWLPLHSCIHTYFAAASLFYTVVRMHENYVFGFQSITLKWFPMRPLYWMLIDYQSREHFLDNSITQLSVIAYLLSFSFECNPYIYDRYIRFRLLQRYRHKLFRFIIFILNIQYKRSKLIKNIWWEAFGLLRKDEQYGFMLFYLFYNLNW